MRKHIRSFLVYVGVGMLLLTGFESYAQTLLKHNWYFGNTNRSIRFNRVTNAPTLITNKAVPFGTGGSAVANDRSNGNLLFYTDGGRIYDANHRQMPNGNGLNGNVAGNQPVAICPVPGQAGKYFVFTNTANFTAGGSISYSVVDMGLFGNSAFPSPAAGDVEVKNTPIPALVGVSEGMMTIAHTSSNEFWLITQNINSRAFNATLINAASYTSSTFATLTSNAANIPTTAAHLAYHEGLRKLAVAPQDASTDAITLNFNPTTGAIGFDRIILNTGVLSTTDQAIYDIEWSATGRYIYISRHGEVGPPPIQGNVFQYDYSNSAITLAPVLPAPVFRSYGLQRGPDNRIYHLFQRTSAADPFLLGRIDSPDSVADRTHYTAAPPNLANLNFDGRQFPGFLPRDTVRLRLDFTYAGECQNSPTIFFPFVRPGADSLQWNFGDGTGASAWSPAHTYAQSGAFSVTLRAYYQGQIDSVTKPVTIRAFALTLQMTSDTTACREEFPPPRGSAAPADQFRVKVTVQGGTASSIVWSNGDLGDTLTPDSAGYYYVVVTDIGGCSAYAGVNVREYGLQSQRFNKWYFGNRAGIDFTIQPPRALNESVMNAPEGCAIVCDPNGNAIFYTDGVTVFDKTHVAIATNIGGNTASTQSSLIIPLDSTLFYIFTTQAINGSDSLQLNYSLFDLKRNGGRGEVVQQEILMFMKSTERLTASGRWLVVHEMGNSTFRSYPVSRAGIGNQVYSDEGTDHSAAIQQNGEGYMKLGPRNLLAVPISTPGVSNRIEVFTLSDTTGRLRDYKNINLNEPNGSIYGLEFSPAGRKMFASVRYSGGTSAIYEYSIDSLLRIRFRQRIAVAADIGAIQVAPNGQILVATNSAANNTSLGMIIASEDTLQLSTFNLQGFTLAAGTNSRLGLPNFRQQNSDPLGGPGITVTGLCAGDSTRFSATPRDQIDEYNWRVFRDGSFLQQSNQATFAALLPGPGNYSVTLQLHNRCAPDTTMSENFVITPPPANPGRGVPLCNTPTVDLDANPTNVAGLTFQWDTGETTEVLTVSDQGAYQVVITDQLGCTTTGRFLAADSRPIYDLGPDLTICEDNSTPALNVANPGMTYRWTIDGVPASTSAVQAIDVTTAGVFRYEVTVTDPFTTCFRTEDKVYSIKASPDFFMSGVNPTSCGTATGSISINLRSTATGGPLYSYFISGPGGTSANDLDRTAPNIFTVSNVPAGTFSAVVQDQISGCTISQSFGLSDAGYSASAAVVGPNCDPVTLRVTTATVAVPATFPVTYTATNGATGAVVTGTGPAPGPAFNITQPLTAGTYTIQVRDAGGCIFSFNHSVTPDPVPAITITPDMCNLTLTAAGANAATYQWSANPAIGLAGNFNGQNLARMTSNSGNVTYTVTGNTGSCNGTQSITLNVANIPTPTLAQTTECADNATITVTPQGTFNYRWFNNGTYDPTLGGPVVQIGLPENGRRYEVQIFEPQSGCVRNSAPLTASVVGVVDASLSSTPPCDDDQPITLTVATVAVGATFAWTRDGVALPLVTTPTTQQTAEGRYQVEVRKSSCRATSSLLITRAPLPEGSLGNIAVICDDPENQDPSTASVDLDPGIFVAYDWLKNGASLNYTQRVYTADSKGAYEVTITDARGCKNKDEIDVRNECLPKVNAPNAFRPGSARVNKDRPDLSNGEFWIFTRFIEDEQFKVFIFNRWGEMVYTSGDRNFQWNGGYNNDLSKPLPPGTYSYVVQYVSAFRPDQGVQEKRGGVALLR